MRIEKNHLRANLSSRPCRSGRRLLLNTIGVCDLLYPEHLRLK
jgi:hypothetical protein